MRLATILSRYDLPSAELQAGVLDGELMRIGGAYCAIDTIIGSRDRAASIATEVAVRSIAERQTAGWVYGVVDELPRRLQLCVTSRSNVRPTSSQRCVFREVVLDDTDVVMIGGLCVTTPLRTAIDIARIDEEFSILTASTVRGLASLGRGFTLEDCEIAMTRRRNLPHKRLAMTRIASALREQTQAQPALTRYTS